MWPTTTRFNEVLYEPARRWASKVEVLYGNELVTTLDVVLDGSIEFDDVAVRRSCNLRMIDPDGILTPASAADLLAPKGTELRLYRGLMVDGEYEYVPLGVFGIVEPEVTAHGSGTQIKVKGWDRVDAIRTRRFDEAYPIASGTATWQAISDIVTSRLDVPVRITQTGNTTPEVVYDALSDPWDAVRKLAAADSLSAYFDPLGTLVVEPYTETATGIVYEPGTTSLLVETSRIIKSDTTYSGVIVKGEHPETGAIRSVLWDTDVTSPTYYLGPFGKRPYGYSSPLIDSQSKADAAAASILPRVTKMKQEITIRTIGHPGHDIGDVATVIDSKSRTNGVYVVSGGSIPLRPNGTIRLKLVESSS
jgi:hypothetical protein